MAQGSVKIKGNQISFCVKTLGDNHLDNIPGLDIFPGSVHHGAESLLCHVGLKFVLCLAALHTGSKERNRNRRPKKINNRINSFYGIIIKRLAVNIVIISNPADHRNCLFETVMDQNDSWNHE